eukprot:5411838-Amphidinium_carterae.2
MAVVLLPPPDTTATILIAFSTRALDQIEINILREHPGEDSVENRTSGVDNQGHNKEEFKCCKVGSDVRWVWAIRHSANQVGQQGTSKEIK